MAGVGCAPTSTPPSETRAWVRLEALERQHPFWPELARLDRALRRAPLPGPTASKPAPQADPARRDGAATMKALAEAQQRREKAREQLLHALQEGLSAFLAGESERLEIFLAGKRGEMESEDRRLYLEAERTERDIAEQAMRAALESVIEDLALLRTTAEALDAQLREGFVVGVSDAALEAELKRLGNATAELETRGGQRGIVVRIPPDAGNVSPRARLTASRDAVRRRIVRLEAQVEQQRGDHDKRRIAALETVRREAAERTERRVEQLRKQGSVEIEPILQRQEFEDLLDRTLGLEAAPARDLADATVARPAAKLRWETPPGPESAAARGPLERERTRLTEWIRADVLAAVKDVAQAQRIRVAFEPGASVPDRTDAFAVWIRQREERARR